VPIGLALVGAYGLMAVAVSQAASTPLHLAAMVYDVHDSGGTVSSWEKLYEEGVKHGEDYSRCTPTSQEEVHCVGRYMLERGEIAFAGSISKSSTINRLAITGGTGAYKHAHGTVLTEYNRAGTRAKETITFSS
jgi:hypothetical protein